jgi:protease I
MENLKNKIVAILATDGFEESELVSPKKALEKNGAEVHVVSFKHGNIKAWKDGNWSIEVPVDRILEDVKEEDYDALMIPGGVINPDKLRKDESAVSFVKSFFANQKPVAAICHGPWVLIEADVVRGRRMTSYSSIKTDLINAGADWVDEEVVVDNGMVTSRDPDDLDAFNSKLVEEIMEGQHSRQML